MAKSFGTVDGIMDALQSHGLKPVCADLGPFAEIRVEGRNTPGRTGRELITLIVPDRFSATPEEAAALAETISIRLESIRGAARCMTATDGKAEDGRPPERGKAMVIPADLWTRKREMMTGRILAHCGIFSRVYARNCEVRRIRKPDADAFADAFHSYGTALCRNRYGLYVLRETASTPAIPAGTLVAVAEFSNLHVRRAQGREIRSYEWIRYVSLPNVRVEGGMGKILRKFIGDVRPDEITTCADLEWSDGSAYPELGFTPAGLRAPVLFSVDPLTLVRTPLSGSRKACSYKYSRHTAVYTTATAATATSTPPAATADAGPMYYLNFGSLRYRLTIQWNRDQ